MKKARHKPASRKLWRVFVMCGALLVLTWLVFGQSVQFGYVNYDDDEYVSENVRVLGGLSIESVAWAFTHFIAHSWVPFTTLSHMFVCQVFGPAAGSQHFLNVLLHSASVVLLFLSLRNMTGALWRSLFVAALFAVHPLRAESVAWITERKDVLSGLCFIATLMAYHQYVMKPGALRYITALILFALALLAKPIVVSLPLILLLLDYWPLGRVRTKPVDWKRAGYLLFEKIPILVLALAGAIPPLLARSGGASPSEMSRLGARLANAAITYAIHIWQLGWPVGLSPFYPYAHLSSVEVILATLLLLGITLGVCFYLKPLPYLAVGWFWYLTMLLPVCGVVQVALHARADRNTYLASIGLFICLVWGTADICQRWRISKMMATGFGVSAVLLVAFLGRQQTSYWRTSTTLWRHALEVTSNNYIAHTNYCSALLRDGKLDQARRQGELAIAARPDFANAHNNYGVALLQSGETDEGVRQLGEALRLNRNLVGVHRNLALVSIQRGDLAAAVAAYRAELQLAPDDLEARNNLAYALAQQGQNDEAATQWRIVLRLNPVDGTALNNLAWLLITSGSDDSSEVVSLARRAAALRGEASSAAFSLLAAAYAEAGRFDEAVATAERGLQLARTQEDLTLARTLQGEVELFRAGKRWREAR